MGWFWWGKKKEKVVEQVQNPPAKSPKVIARNAQRIASITEVLSRPNLKKDERLLFEKELGQRQALKRYWEEGVE